MNERIKELYNEVVGNDRLNFDSYLAEKFAELIVRECAKIANRQFETATGLDDRDCLTANEMKQYFGVQE